MASSKIELYVSPAGNDAWSGGLPNPAADGSDGPLRTLEAAQAAVRHHLANLREPTDLRVCLRGGTYELAQPWLFMQADSGFGRRLNQRAQTWPVTWAAYPGETPVVSGGHKLTSPWRSETVNGRTAWVTEIDPAQGSPRQFRQLWVNGQRRQRARLPKAGTLTVDRALDANYVGSHGETIRRGSCRFGFRPGELRADWRNLADVEILFLGWWMSPRAWLTEIDEAQQVAWLDRNTSLRLAWGANDGIDYVVENVFEALTEPGEWYLDRPTGKLYYLPMPGEELDSAEIVAPRLSCLLRLEQAANLRFEGITFAHNEWRQPAGYAGAEQSSVEVPGAVVLHQADNCQFHHCRILHTGTYGVDIDRGTTETILDHCELRDLGAGGVKIWHGCRRNVVANCEIADGGHLFPSGVGVLIGKATGNRVEHCHIHDFYYSGVSVGWNWGYAESDGYGNLIEWNHIHDLGKGLLSDMGGIYLLGHAAGTRVRHNHIHDISCRRYGGWCIYPDEGSTDLLIENNLCHHANKDPFHQHYGRNNLVRNNIFAYGGDAVLAYGAQEPHLGVIFESNIFLARDTPILRNAGPDRWTPAQTRFQGNLYWCENGPVVFNHGNGGQFASQSFPNGYQAEAARFAPLPEMANLDHLPSQADWQKANPLTHFVNHAGNVEAPAGTAELRFLRQGDTLHLQARFQRPPQAEATSGALWNREHLELFLKPFANQPGMVQLGLAADGETACLWHGCQPPPLDWQAEAVDTANGWQATLRLPLAAIAAAGQDAPQWSFLAGFATPPPVGDWSNWQAGGHDPEGVVADPLFVDPEHGDFRLRPDSPALALGFVPFAVPKEKEIPG